MAALGLLGRRGPHGADPHADGHMGPGARSRAVGDDHVGAVEQDERPDKRLRLGLPRVLHRGDDDEVGDRPGGRQVDLALRRELDRVDRALAPTARVHPPQPGTGGRGVDGPGTPRPPVAGLGDRVAIGDRGHVVHRVTGSAAPPVSSPSVSGVSPGTKQTMSVMWPVRVPLQRGATRIPSAMAAGEPASTAWSRGVEAPSSRTKANANGRSSGCCSVGSGTHVHDSTVPAGPTSTSSWGSSAPVAGSHSMGGTSTESRLRTKPQLPFAIAFLAGFSERFTIQLIDKVMGVLLGTPDSKPSEKKSTDTKKG